MPPTRYALGDEIPGGPWSDRTAETIQQQFERIFRALSRQPTLLGLVTAAANIDDNAIVRGDGGLKGIQGSIARLSDTGVITVAEWQGTVIAVGFGGTGITSYTIGDLLYASGTAALAKLAAVATGNALISGGVATAPAWGKIGLTTHVSGRLPYANLTASLAASSLLGRGSAAGAGDWQDITLGSGLTMTGTVLDTTVSAAPADAQYLVAAAHATLTAERVATDTATVAWDFGTAAQAKANVPDNAITDAKLRDSAGFSVIGKATTGSGDPADIVAADETVLGRTGGGNLAFAQVATGQIANDAVTFAKVQNITGSGNGTLLGRNPSGGVGDIEQISISSSNRLVEITAGSVLVSTDRTALSVIGRSANTTGVPADIVATTDQVLRESGGVLGFGTVATGGIADGAVTNVKTGFTWTTVSFNAGDFTAVGGGSWTVASGDVTTFQYAKLGRYMAIMFAIDTSTVAATANELNILIPGSFTSNKLCETLIFALDNLTYITTRALVDASGTQIRLLKTDGTAWSNSTNQTYVRGTVIVETTA